MPSCIVKGCGSRSSKNSCKSSGEKLHFFKIPKDNADAWKKAIKRDDDSAVTSENYVCHKHFLPHEFSKTKIFRAADGTVIAEVRDILLIVLFYGNFSY